MRRAVFEFLTAIPQRHSARCNLERPKPQVLDCGLPHRRLPSPNERPRL